VKGLAVVPQGYRKDRNGVGREELLHIQRGVVYEGEFNGEFKRGSKDARGRFGTLGDEV